MENRTGSNGRRTIPGFEGMKIPATAIVLEGKEFWDLIGEGWRLFLDQNGKVLGYLPPTLAKRLESYNNGNHKA